MAIAYHGFFDSIVGDERNYTQASMARFARALSESGVSDERSLAVSSANDGLNVIVAYGMAVVDGFFYSLEDDGGGAQRISLSAPASKSRIDRIVLRCDSTTQTRTVALEVISGKEASAPTPPALTRSESVYDISLARVTLTAGMSLITGEQITDERTDPSVCGVLQGGDRAAYALAQQGVSDARAAQLAAQDADEKAAAAQLAADKGVLDAGAAQLSANTANDRAVGTHYWAVNGETFTADDEGWVYEAESERYYKDFAVTDMTEELIPFVNASSVGASFSLCGCKSLAGQVRLYMCDAPSITSDITVYGLAVRA